MFEKEKKRKREKAASFSTRFNSFLKDSVVEPLRVRAYMLRVRFAGFLCYLVSSLSVHTKMFLYFYRKYVGIVVAYLPTQGFKHWLRGPIRSSALMSPSDTVASELLDAWHLSVWNLKTWPALWCPSQSKCFTWYLQIFRCKVETSVERSRVNPSRGGGDIGTTDRQTHTKKKTRWSFEMMFSFDTHSELLLFGMASMSGGPTRVTRGPSHGKWHVTKCRALGGGNKTANVRRRSPQLVIAV